MKKFLTALTLMVVLTFSTTFANTGILVAGANAPAESTSKDPCTQQTEKVDSGILVAGATGILVAGLTGILVAGFTGILVAGATDDSPVNCGILVAG